MLYQKGYATVLTLVLFSALGLSLFAMFNSGQIVTHKLKLQNAVDAATYSSVNVVAREMNYMAYTNRAMVSNQLAIGQMVGLYSWHRKTKDTVDTLDTAATFLTAFPPTSAIGASLQNATSLIAKAFKDFDPFLKNTIKLGISFEKPAITALSVSQEGVHLATSAILLNTFDVVLQDNNDAKGDSKNKIEYSALIPAKLFQSIESKFIDRVSSPTTNFNGVGGGLADYDAFASIIKQTDDGFVHNRNNMWLDLYVPPGLINVFVGLIDPGKAWRSIDGEVRIHDNGGSDFDRKVDGSSYNWEWSAMDTVSLWVKYKYLSPKWWDPFRTKTKDREWIPIGGGAAHASKKPTSSDDIYDSYYDPPSLWNWNQSVKRGKWGDAGYNQKSAKNAASNDSNKKLGATSQLHSFYKFKKKNQEIIGPEFIALVSKDQSGVRTRNQVIENQTGNPVPNNGSFNIEKEGNLADGNNILAIAKAQVYFSRSPDSGFGRDDSKQEVGNLFNPYWQVRLTKYSSAEIQAAKLVLKNAP